MALAVRDLSAAPAAPKRHAGGRPPNDDPYRPPRCPDGHAGTIQRDGTYARGPYHERISYRCRPFDRTIESHRIHGLLPSRHPTPSHPHSGEACATCEHVYEPHEGPKTAGGFVFSIAEIVDILMGIGQGDSARESAALARRAALRFLEDGVAKPRPNAKWPEVEKRRQLRAEAKKLVEAGAPESAWPAPVLGEVEYGPAVPGYAAPGETADPWSPGALEPARKGAARAPRATDPGETPAAPSQHPDGWFDVTPWTRRAFDPASLTPDLKATGETTTLRELGLVDDLSEEDAPAEDESLESPFFWVAGPDERRPILSVVPAPADLNALGVDPAVWADLGIVPFDQSQDWPADIEAELQKDMVPFEPFRGHDDDQPSGANQTWQPLAFGRVRLGGHDHEDTHDEVERLLAQTVVSRSPSLVLDYLDFFGPVVLEPMAPKAWPRVVILDSLPLRRPTWRKGERVKRGRKAGEIVAVIDATDPRRPMPILICVAGGKDRWTWQQDILGRLPGHPEWVVTDGDPALEKAIAAGWPQAIHYRCEGHLLKNARDAALEDGVREGPAESRNPVWVTLDTCLWSVKRWDAFKATVQAKVPAEKTALRGWIDRNETLVLAQIALRKRNPMMPRGTGVAEAILQEVGRVVKRRAAAFRNRRRLDLVLGLMCAQLAHRAKPIVYAARIRALLTAREGWTQAKWDASRDKGGTGSIDELITACERRAAIEAVNEQNAAVAVARQRRVADRREAQATSGVDGSWGHARRPDGPGGGSRIDLTGMMLSDFPDLVAQMHPGLNPGIDPTRIHAGSETPITWLCLAHSQGGPNFPGHEHVWTTKVSSRLAGNTGCPFCMRTKTCPGNNITVTDPDIAREWHPTLNEHHRAEEYRPGSHFLAWWDCSKPGHPPFQKEIRARTRYMYQCPQCGLERRKEKHLEAQRKRRKEVRALAIEARAEAEAAEAAEAPGPAGEAGADTGSPNDASYEGPKPGQ